MLGKLDRDIALGVIALFVLLLAGGAAMVNAANTGRKGMGMLPSAHRQIPPLPIDAAATVRSPHAFRGPCHLCHPLATGFSAIPILTTRLPSKPGSANGAVPAWLFRPPSQSVRPRQVGPAPSVPMTGAARPRPSGPQRVGGTGLRTPLEQQAASKMMVEGHWLGMEVMDLTPALRRIYRVPADVAGVIVDEITLESAESGILAGDVITGIQGRRTRDLAEFAWATQAVGERERAEVAVYRLGAERRFVLAAKNAPTLGFAQMEGAQPIRPGALSPHRAHRRACTDCHVIMTTGGQLPVDAGDVVPTPPAIAANAAAPHAYRGECGNCHVIR